MTFQAYIDNIQAETGKIPADFKRLARKAGLLKPDVKARAVVAWLKREFGLGHGHAMAIYATFKGRKKQSSRRRNIADEFQFGSAARTNVTATCSRACRPFEVRLYIDGKRVTQELRQRYLPLLQDMLAWVLTRQMSYGRKEK